MINAKSDINFIYLNIRSLIGFKLKSFLNYFINGHIFRYIKIKNYLNNEKNIKIHFGSTYELKGFINSQIHGKIPIDITKKLPFKDRSIDLIYSSHLIEHIHRKEINFFISESFRVLKPGGYNIISTPSINRVIEVCYGKNNKKKKLLFKHGESFYNDKFYSTAHQINILMRGFGHRFIVDTDFMKKISESNGFSKMNILNNISELPDKTISNYLKKRKSQRWFLETETYCLKK